LKGKESLATVLDIATRKREASLQALARARNEQQMALMQMSQLQGYTAESMQRWSQRASRGVSVMLLHTQQSFMTKLEHAVNFQHGVLDRLNQNVQRCQQQLFEAERELASLQKVQQRRIEAWQKDQQRQEQRTTDEMAANQHWQHASAHPWRSQP
jgi:flagellar FliJ protein